MSEKTTVSAPKRDGGDWQNVSQGLHVAVCVDVLDKWEQPRPERFRKPGQSKTITKTKLVWETPDELDTEGRPLIVGEFYTASLFERAKLRQHLESWRGRPFTEPELEAFDLENVIGAPCQIHVVHTKPNANGQVYANVAAVVPLGKGQEKPKPSEHYVRVKDREEAEGADPGEPAGDDDIPF